MTGRRIYLVAPSGFPHYGDELVASQWLRYLARTEPDAEVWLDSPSPAQGQLLLGGLHPQVRFVDTVFQLGWNAAADDARTAAEFAAEATRNPGFAPRWGTGVELLHGADVYHLLGGGYVNGTWPRHHALVAVGAVLATEFGARAAMTGQGLLPATDVPALLNELASAYTVVDVRDEQSGVLVGGDRVTETGDDALLDPGSHLYDERETPSMMLCIQSDGLDVELDDLVKSVHATIESWRIDSTRVGYVEALPGGDRRVYDLLQTDLPGIRFYPFTEVWRAGLPARRGQRWLTTRLHTHLMAAAVGAWGVAYPVNDASRIEHEALVSDGSRWTLATPGETPATHHGDAGFGTRIDELTAAKQAVAERVYAQ